MFKKLSTFFGPLVAIDTDTRITSEINELGHWEFVDLLNIIKVYENTCGGRTGTMLDIGCNVGSWLLPTAQRYTQNKILAIDCQRLAIDCVAQTVELNNLQNVQTMCCAMSNVCGKKDYNVIDYQCGANFGAYELEPPYAASDFNGRMSENVITLDVRTVDSLMLSDVVFIKLDVEGMEYQVLCGAENTIKQCQPFIAFENHKTNSNAAVELLTNLNYRIDNNFGQMTIAIPKIYL